MGTVDKKVLLASLREKEAELIKEIMLDEHPDLKEVVIVIETKIVEIKKLDTELSKPPPKKTSTKEKLLADLEKANISLEKVRARIERLTEQIAALDPAIQKNFLLGERAKSLIELESLITKYDADFAKAGVEVENVLPIITPFLEQILK